MTKQHLPYQVRYTYSTCFIRGCCIKGHFLPSSEMIFVVSYALQECHPSHDFTPSMRSQSHYHSCHAGRETSSRTAKLKTLLCRSCQPVELTREGSQRFSTQFTALRAVPQKRPGRQMRQPYAGEACSDNNLPDHGLSIRSC